MLCNVVNVTLSLITVKSGGFEFLLKSMHMSLVKQVKYYEVLTSLLCVILTELCMLSAML